MQCPWWPVVPTSSAHVTATRPPLLLPVLAADLGRSREIITSTSRSRVDSIQWPCLLGGTRLFREYFVLCVMYTVKQPVFYSTLIVQALVRYWPVRAGQSATLGDAAIVRPVLCSTVQYCAPCSGLTLQQSTPRVIFVAHDNVSPCGSSHSKGLVHTRELVG